MTRKSLSFCLALLIALAPGLPALAAPAPANLVHPIEEKHIVTDPATFQGYVDNLMVVITKPGIAENQVLSWFPEEKAEVVGRFPGLDQLQIRIKPRSKPELDKLANALMARDEVLFAHTELAARMPGSQSQPAEEEREEDWPEDAYADAHFQPNQNKPKDEWWYEAVGLKEAQTLADIRQYVKVAVLDDGFDTGHADLKLAFVDDAARRMNLPEAHGTHVAGIVQQILPGATLTVQDTYPLPEQTESYHLLAQCQQLKDLVDLVEAGVKVLNYSMGYDTEEDELMPWVRETAGILSVYMWLLKQKGHEFIAVQSAGNLGLDAVRNGYFASISEENCLGSQAARQSLGVSGRLKEAQQAVFDSIVIVGASEPRLPSGRYAYQEGSSYGPLVTLAAPGKDINSSVPGGYHLMGGTSQAAPVAAGALGLIWSVRPELSAGEVKRILTQSARETAEDISPLGPKERRRLYPVVNMLEAVKLARETKP